MNRFRHLTSPKNLNSNELTIEMRTTELTQGDWVGKSSYHDFNNCSSRGALPNRLAAGSRWALIAMYLAKTSALFGYTIFFPFPSHPVLSQRLYEDSSYPFIPVDMARGQAKPNIKNSRRQPSISKGQGEVFGVRTSSV